MSRIRRIPSPRRGAILLVVVALLTLFALVGLSFVLYAEAAARSALLAREAESTDRPDVDPEFLFAYFLGQFLYDVPDDERGAYSALRGHSLARNMYGGHDGSAAAGPYQPAANLVPFSGVGRLRGPSPFGDLVPGAVLDDAQLLNYTYHPVDSQLPPGQRFLRDPERLRWRAPDLAAPRGAFLGGFNAPYTYPDLTSTFLAAVRADGAVLLPSFFRPWAATVPGFPADAGEFCDRATGNLNDWWAPGASPPPWFKYTTLRPLPSLHPGFPVPDDGGGDVKNLVGGPGTFRRLNPSTDKPEYWNNDSFWMDLGFPVRTAPDGRRYKPLFAALITDLDNRLNVGIHGNTGGADGEHRSNQGWGPWEVNLERVLPDPQGREFRNLLRGTARPAQPGRHGGSPWLNRFGLPGPLGGQSAAGPLAHFYSQMDFDGRDENTGGATGRMQLPGPGLAQLSSFPSYLKADGTPQGFGNHSTAERRSHPLLYNPFRPAGEDRVFARSNMEALLRYGQTGSAGLTSDLLRLCPLPFTDPRIRGMMTTHSLDLDRPGIMPWIQDPASHPYDAAPTDDPDHPTVPVGAPIPFPALSGPGLPPLDPRNPTGEFGPTDWRALSASLGRINLSQPLPPYPHQGSGQSPPFGPPLTVRGTGVALDMPFNVDSPNGPIWGQFVLAQVARQRLAEDIYRRLLAVTGVAPLREDQVRPVPPATLLSARRWLAQLAANIVDYVDEDDISTPFCFFTAEDYKHLPFAAPDPGRVDPDRPASGTDGEIQWPLYWVFGTELPRLLVNEVLAEINRLAPDESYSGTVRVFVELHNPFPRMISTGLYQPDSFPVPLRMGAGGTAFSPYRLVLGVKSAVTSRPTGAAVLPNYDNSNVLGNPETKVVRKTTTDGDFTSPLATVGGSGQPEGGGVGSYEPIPSPHVPAHGPAGDDVPQGFLLLAPTETTAPDFAPQDPFSEANRGLVPPATPLLRTATMQYTHPFTVRQPGDPPDERTEGVTVLLRRLANPYLPFDGRRRVDGVANPTYNPFVTVDYLEDIPVQPVEPAARPLPVSRGKLQPYAAHRGLLRDQVSQPQPNLRNSFGRDNDPTADPHDWLTHLDRPPVSPMELVHVSGYQPYQLTQRFITQDPAGVFVRFSHRAPWLDEGQEAGGLSHRIYRLLEFLQTGPLCDGIAGGGRIPGKVNLNTVWEPEILRALCDAQPSNSFTQTEVDTAFVQHLYDPKPNATPNPQRRTQGYAPGAADRPLRNLGVGSYPVGDAQVPSGGGVYDSFLRLQPPPSGVHPYQDNELVTKLFNQVTTRSNVFAVWLTVGFFEVTDESTRPVRLGGEIGRSENRHVRHRMFALLDRTNLSIASCVASLAEPVPPPFASPFPLLPNAFAVSALGGTTRLPVTGRGLSWGIGPGTTLVVDTGENQETVVVLDADGRTNPPTITAVFTRPHAAGAPIALANVPGEPPVFLKPRAVTGPPPPAQAPFVPRPPYSLTIRLDVDVPASNPSSLVGTYDGIRWMIRPGAKLILDVGPRQEVVTVLPGPFALDGATATGSFRVIVTKPHGTDFVLSNTLLGNPGPQPRFNPRDPSFAAVVRHVSIIQ